MTPTTIVQHTEPASVDIERWRQRLQLLPDQLGEDAEQILRGWQSSMAELERARTRMRRLEQRAEDLAAQLEDERARADQLFHLADAAYLVTDLEGRVVDCNAQAAQMCDRGRTALLGRRFVAEHLVEDEHEVEALLLSRVSSSQWCGANLHLRTSKRVAVHGRVIRIASQNRPSTHLWSLCAVPPPEEQADAKETASGLAVLSHELRGPLACIQTGLDLLLTCGDGQGPKQRVLRVIESQVKQMTRLVGDMLDAARGRQGRLELACGPVGLQGAVEQAVASVRSVVDEHAQTLRVDLPPRPIVVHADEGRLVQILSNLLENASKYTPDGKALGIRVGVRDGDAVIVVWDEGIGLRSEAVDRLFEMFQQGRAVEGREAKGMGIGLSLATILVRLHGGRLRVISPRPSGQPGTAFEVVLPGAKVQYVAPNTLEVTPPRQGRRILVVEDEPELGTLMVELLRSRGHDPTWTSTATEALERVESIRPELVLCDIGLPDMGGHQLGRELRRRYPGLRLVAMSGSPSSLQVEDADPFDDHLAKPVSLAVIEGLLAEVPCQRPSSPTPRKAPLETNEQSHDPRGTVAP